MPGLRDLHSRLSALKFGHDRPGGGNSGEPYVRVGVEGEWSPNNFDDTIVPFGAVTAGTRTLADMLRITRFLVDPPKGPLWAAHQAGLQMSNPQLEHRTDREIDKVTSGQGFIRNAENFVANEANKIANDVGVTRVFTPANTMAQVAGSAFGQHFTRHGFTPTMEDADKYEQVVRDNNQNGNNRLEYLSTKFTDSNNKDEIISEYKGGPNSFNGIGKTTIKREEGVNTMTGFDNTDIKRTRILKSFIPLPLSDIQMIDESGESARVTGVHKGVVEHFNFHKKDFREYKNLIIKDGQKKLPHSDYAQYNLEKRVGIARARTSAEHHSDYMVDVEDASDKINALGLYYSDSPHEGVAYLDAQGLQSQIVTPEGVRDLIKFRIKAIDNDKPDSGVYMTFRAFLNNIDRRLDAQWNEFSYVGRGESFYSYNGFKSVISFDFTIAALSRREMRPLYQKLNYLYSTLTPDYKNNKMRGNLVELTIGDYIHYQPGIITSMFISIPEEANWEIALNEPDDTGEGRDKDMHELPMMLRVGINFTPIYDFLPRKSAELPFFGIDDRENPNDLNSKKHWTIGMDNTIKSKH